MGTNAQAWKIGFKWTKGDASNPTGAIGVDTTSKALHITDVDDIATDWNVAADSHPSVYVHSATTPATDYIKMHHDATDGFINSMGGLLKLQTDGTTALTISAAQVVTLAARDVHSAGLTVADAFAVIQGMNTFPKLTVTVLTSGAGYNMSAAQLLSGCISDTSATGAIAATLPSVASVVALIPGYVAGTAFYLDMRNPGNQTITLTVDSGAQWTLVGTMTIATVTNKRFLCVINSGTTGTIYSVGASTA